jgi:hypothetical protein
VIWTGRPWILPGIVLRTVLVHVVAAVVVWLEFSVGVASVVVLGVSVLLWTLVLFHVVWLFSLFPLLLLRASHFYVLRYDGMEVKEGIATMKSFVLAPSGFSDLEVLQSVSARAINYGDIIIRTQSERVVALRRVKDPLKVAEQIREVMGKPIVRIEGQSRGEKQ